MSARTGHQRSQAEWFDDEVDAEWEIERPHGAPPFHVALLDYKFAESLAALGDAGAETALCVCAGSGMDAEFLARRGLRVTATDISSRAVERIHERSIRHGIQLESLVAAVERLPFDDQSFDLVYVHDGLHHLEKPLVGLAEMARVARIAVSVTEPAQAALTRAAVRLGLALEREPAGNRVARLSQEEIRSVLADSGFAVVYSKRYLMRYAHRPGRLSAALSAPGIFTVASAGFHAANAVAARAGNKLTVQAVRRQQ